MLLKKTFPEEFLHNPKCKKLMELIVPENMSEILYQDLKDPGVYIPINLFDWINCGKKTFYITEEIAAKLIQTELKNIETQFFKVPYQIFYIEIPDHIFIHKNYAKVRGFFIRLDTVLGLTLIPVGGIGYSFSSSLLNINLEKSRYLDEVIDNLSEFHVDEQPFESEEDIQYFKNIYSFIINVVLYINSKNPDLVEYDYEKIMFKSRGEYKRGKALYSQQRIIICGANTKNNIQYESSGERKILKRFTVRGHWRKQWVGSKKNDSREQILIWIQPFEKGTDFGEYINSKYIVK